jgi:ADP-ribosylglycohydrolase
MQAMFDKVKTTLLGGMLGDAYGNRFSNMDIPTKDEVWRFTDATQLTIATCESLMETHHPQADHIALKFADYYRDGKIAGMTPSTLRSLILLSMGKRKREDGPSMTTDVSESPGAAMRIAPLAFLLDPHEESDQTAIRSVCKITDEGDEAFAGALAVLLSIRLAQNARQNFIPQVIRLLPESRTRENLVEITRNPDISLRRLLLQREQQNHAADSVPIALLAAQKSATAGIRTVWKELVSSARDGAILCSIAGQIAGAFLTENEFPTEWVERVRTHGEYQAFDGIARQFQDHVLALKGVRSLF